MITKKKKSSINISKKKLIGGSSKSTRGATRASSAPLPRVSIKEKGFRRHSYSLPGSGDMEKQGGTLQELIKLKKEVAGHLKKSPLSSVESLDDDDDDDEKKIS